jgi:hypothetical protein
MSNNLVGNPAGVTSGSCRIKIHRTVIPPWFWVWNWPDHFSAARPWLFRWWRRIQTPYAPTSARRWGRFLIYLLSRYFRSHQEAVIIRR